VNIEPKFFPVDVDLASLVVIAAQQRGLPVADFVNGVMRAIWGPRTRTWRTQGCSSLLPNVAA
jgi:hypothetical protein